MRDRGDVHSVRIARLRRRLKELRLDGLAVFHLPNIRYLTGFTGSSGAVYVGRRAAVFITDFRYKTQAEKQVACRVMEHKSGLAEAVGGMAASKRIERLGFESMHTSWAFHAALRKRAGKVRLVPTTGVIEGLRAIKDQGELSLMKKAIGASAKAFTHACKQPAGKQERAIAVAMERLMVESGAEAAAFPTIVASGPRGALPHAVPGRSVVRKGKLTVIDFGARVKGYHSDTTRTIVSGKVPRRAKELYGIVREAQKAAFDTIRPGVKASEVDRAAREVIAAAGYGDSFGHGTGHGVGLEVHESPIISPKSGDVLAPGMVFTVEPGIYVKDFGGVRIEDMVLVTAKGYRILTGSIPKRAL